MHRSFMSWVIASALAATACGPCPSPTPESAGAIRALTLADHRDVYSSVITDQPCVVAPTRNLQVNKDRSGWRLSASAAVMVHLTSPFQGPLDFALSSSAASPDELLFTWDGEALAATADGQELITSRIRIPTAGLGPGTHALMISRRVGSNAAGSSDILAIQSISYTVAGRSHTLEPSRFHRYHYIADFLGHGVTGSRSQEKLSGILFDGPGETTLEVGGGTATELLIKVQNSSPAPATFCIRSREAEVEEEVASHSKLLLRLPVGPAPESLHLEAAGNPSGLFLWGAPHLRSSRTARTPIILITLDTTRRDVVPPFASDAGLMPRLAELVAEATVYSRAVTTSPWTLPSHASIFTGLYPSRHRAGVTDQELEPSLRTAAELIRDAGYLTAGVAGGFFCSSRFGLSQGFTVYHDPGRRETSGDKITDAALSVLDEFGDVPLFLFANYFDPHYPYVAPEKYRRDHGADLLSEELSDHPAWSKVLAGQAPGWPQTADTLLAGNLDGVQALTAEYRAEVQFMDHQIGRLLDRLRSQGLYDQALIVVVADHGELLGEDGFFGHGCRLDPHLVHVPLIIKQPGQHENHMVDEMVTVVDLFPTLLETAGVIPPTSDGLSLLEGSRDTRGSRPWVYSEEHAMGIHKLIDHMKIADRLYALDAPGKRQVVWEDGELCFEQHEGLWTTVDCPRGGEAMASVHHDLDPPRGTPATEASDLSDEELAELRALGYLQ